MRHKFLFILTMTFFLSSCVIKKADKQENQYFKLYSDDNYNYTYIIFDKDGNAVKSEQYSREPVITVIDNKMISVLLQAGTGIETRWTYYYDIEENIFSDVFYAVFHQDGGRIIYRKDASIVVRDIFDETKLMQTFDSFEAIAQNVVSPFIEAKFIDNGKTISITYLDENYDERIVTFNLFI